MILLGFPLPLPEHELVVVGEEVVERHAAVHRGSDHRPSVRALEVTLHDLVQLKIFFYGRQIFLLSSHLAVTQHHGLELEALGAQEVDGLLVLVGEPQRLVIPPEPITDQYSVN